jgi:hypothetical protein
VPSDFPVCAVDCDKEGISSLITNKQHFAVKYDRRSPHAIQVVKGPEGYIPELIAIEVVSQQTELRKEHIYSFIVDGRARCGGIVSRIESLDPWTRSFAPPQLTASGAIETDSQ